MNPPNQIIRDGIKYELLSGPWMPEEVFQMNASLRDLRGINHVIDEVDGKQYVYRDSKGYISLAENPGLRKCYMVRNAMLRDLVKS